MVSSSQLYKIKMLNPKEKDVDETEDRILWKEHERHPDNKFVSETEEMAVANEKKINAKSIRFITSEKRQKINNY